MALLYFLWKYHELFICSAFIEIHGKKLISKIAQEAAADSILFAPSPQPVPLRHHFPFLEMWPLIHPIYIFCASGWFLVILVPSHTLCVCRGFPKLSTLGTTQNKTVCKWYHSYKGQKFPAKLIKWFLNVNCDCTFPGWAHKEAVLHLLHMIIRGNWAFLQQKQMLLYLVINFCVQFFHLNITTLRISLHRVFPATFSYQGTWNRDLTQILGVFIVGTNCSKTTDL